MVHSAEDGSIPVADMSVLIARLEAAEAGRRELDREIGEVTRAPMGNAGDVVGLGYAHFTTSLDAALALAERVLPGWLWDVTTITTSVGGLRKPLASVVRPDQPEGEEIKTWGYGSTPALALCIAILKAKAHGEGGQRKTPPCTAGLPEVAKQNWPEAQSSPTPSGMKIRIDEPFTQATPHDKTLTPTTPPDGEGR